MRGTIPGLLCDHRVITLLGSRSLLGKISIPVLRWNIPCYADWDNRAIGRGGPAKATVDASNPVKFRVIRYKQGIVDGD